MPSFLQQNLWTFCRSAPQQRRASTSSLRNLYSFKIDDVISTSSVFFLHDFLCILVCLLRYIFNFNIYNYVFANALIKTHTPKKQSNLNIRHLCKPTNKKTPTPPPKKKKKKKRRASRAPGFVSSVSWSSQPSHRPRRPPLSTDVSVGTPSDVEPLELPVSEFERFFSGPYKLKREVNW